MMITFYLAFFQIDLLYSFLFIARGNAGSRQLTPFSSPTASLLMTEMSLYKIKAVRSFYSQYFSTSPMLCSYPPQFYYASAQYLAFCAESISSRLLVMRRPLPLLSRIVSNNYLSGTYEKLVFRTLSFAQYLEIVKANTTFINYSICIGFNIWYGLMPDFMLSCANLNYNSLLSPVVFNYIKEFTFGLSFHIINEYTLFGGHLEIDPLISDLHGNMFETDAIKSGVSTTSISAELNNVRSNFEPIFDPLGLKEGELKKIVLSKLVISCLAVCVLSTVSYTTVSGTSLFFSS